MTISQVSAKIDLRLNKSASGDYDNIWSYVKEEAFTKGTLEWVRRQIHGKNQTQEGDEESTMRVDDLQILLKVDSLNVRDKGLFAQTDKLPTDYIYYKRLTPIVSKGRCEGVKMKSHLKEEANVDDIIQLPSFKFEETFHTFINNRIHVYHNRDFKVDKAELTYYRLPKKYNFKRLNDVIEFKDDVCELLIDEACKIIASDTESLNQRGIIQERNETNN